MKGKIKFFQKCVAFRPSVLGMRTRSSEGVFALYDGWWWLLIARRVKNKSLTKTTKYNKYKLLCTNIVRHERVLSGFPLFHISKISVTFSENLADVQV